VCGGWGRERERERMEAESQAIEVAFGLGCVSGFLPMYCTYPLSIKMG
jgi:hypothetical protein